MIINNAEICFLFFLSLLIMIVVPAVISRAKGNINRLHWLGAAFIELGALAVSAHTARTVLILFYNWVGTDFVVYSVIGIFLIIFLIYMTKKMLAKPKTTPLIRQA